MVSSNIKASNSISGIEVVAPYGNANAAYHFSFLNDYVTFCGKNREGWTVLETTFGEAFDSAFSCKRCVKAALK